MKSEELSRPVIGNSKCLIRLIGQAEQIFQFLKIIINKKLS